MGCAGAHVSGSHRLDEGTQLGQQGVLRVDLQLLQIDSPLAVRPCIQAAGDRDRLPEKVDGELTVALEEADPAHGLGETRLAVRFATHPPGKPMRALAMSTLSLITGTPIASMRVGSSPTSRWIRSRSWIIRSRTTSTSVPRPGNGPRLWASTNRGLRL